MPGRKRGTFDPFEDIHSARAFNEKRLAELRSGRRIGRDSNPTLSQREVIQSFVRAKRGIVSEVRIRTYLSWLPLAASRLGASFLQPDREIATRFNEVFPPGQYARGTRATGSNCLGTFWAWWFEQQGKERPSWVRIRLEKWKPTNGASDMLSRDEVAQIAEHALNFRDRAWIWTLFNSGCRPGEIYRLRIGDVVVHDEGYIELRVSREKGSAPEPAPIYEDAVPALLAWLGAHPETKNRSAPLWTGLSAESAGQPATYRALEKALSQAARRAGVTKPVTPYALRRSRLTMLAKDPSISGSILEKVAGWVPGSSVAKHYIHLSGRDVIGALNARYGVKSPAAGDTREPTRTPTKCGRCKTLNPAGAAYCMTCGGPLTLPAVKQIEEAKGAEERLAALLRDPAAVEFLARLLAKQEKSKSSRAATSDELGTEGNEVPGVEVHIVDEPRPNHPVLQKVVPLTDAERLIQSGYEFVATLGADRAIVRPPPRLGEAELDVL